MSDANNELKKRKGLESDLDQGARAQGSKSLKEALDKAEGEKVATENYSLDLQERLRAEKLLEDSSKKAGSSDLGAALETVFKSTLFTKTLWKNNSLPKMTN